MPMLYHAVGKVYHAQQLALADGNALKIVEAYRPFTVQEQVVKGLEQLLLQSPEASLNISSPTWSIEWFIYQGVSNHQLGYAIDTTLVKVLEHIDVTLGEYTYKEITRYEEYIMPTVIHDLEIKSARFTSPYSSMSPIAWKEGTFAPTMNEAAIMLHNYCTQAGLVPLASEWWHFHDLDAYGATFDNTSIGNFVITETFSKSIK